MSAIKYVDLPGGYKLPLLGLGSYETADNTKDMRVLLEAAFDNGYRLIDTAYIYKNEKWIGEALKEIFDSGKIKREEVFVTSKVPSQFTGSRENIRTCFHRSLKDLQLDYIDLYLVHFPAGLKLVEEQVTPNHDGSLNVYENHDHLETWKALEELVDEGLVRSIGLSNFNSKQIARIQSAARIPIANVQVECHIYLSQVKLHQFCQQLGITFTAYSTLGSGPNVKDPTSTSFYEDPTVIDIAKKHGKTPAQVLLRSVVQRGIAVLPKSSKVQRIKENSQIFDFELTSEEMERILGLNKNFSLFKNYFISKFAGHPDYPFNEEF